MSENSLPFLDTQIIIKNDQLELCKYRKPMASDCVLNYYAITPKKYKISTLKGEIYRCRHTTSNDKNCDEALVNLKKLFIKNQYPSKLIDQTIAQIRENNFEPKNKNNLLKEEIKRHPEKHYTLALDYNSNRCDKIGYKLFRILKSITPSYKLNIAWRNQTVSQYYSPRLKLSVDPFCKPGVNYIFKCVCDKKYIGESNRQLISRIKEHNQPSSKTAVSEHIYGTETTKPCNIYLDELKNTYGDKPNPKEKLSFITKCFSLKQSNLNNYNTRKVHEAILVTLEKPPLNAQVAHRNLSII